MTHDQASELLVKALSEPLSPAEAEALSTHLAACSACRTEGGLIEGTFDAVIGASRPVQPAARLRDRVLASADLLQGDRARARQVDGEPRRGLWLVRVPRRDSRLFDHPVAGRAAALAAALLVAVLAVTTFVATREIHQQAAAIALDSAALRLLTSTETTNTYLARQSASIPGDAHGHWFHSPDSDTQVVVGVNLPAPRDGERYVVWLGRGGQWAAAGELRVDGQGYGRLVLVNTDSSHVDAILVTLERGSATRPGATCFSDRNNQDSLVSPHSFAMWGHQAAPAD